MAAGMGKTSRISTRVWHPSGLLTNPQATDVGFCAMQGDVAGFCVKADVSNAKPTGPTSYFHGSADQTVLVQTRCILEDPPQLTMPAAAARGSS